MPVIKSKSPIKVGNKVLIRTVTHYHTGRIIEIQKDHLVLDKAAWIADTGRFTDALDTGKLNEVEPFKSPVAVFIAAIIDVTNWSHDLPEAQK